MTKVRNFEPGFVLGRYELVLRVATGGMGEVWAARLKGTRGFQKVVALKFLLPELSHNPNFEQMFLDEAELASRIKHPNVVQVTDLGEEDDILYQVMEWVSGEPLWTAMRAASKKKGVPLDVAARIICQVCAGLHAAHELCDDEGKPIGLVHRDVSPQNILLTLQGIAKVVDFGVAKFAGRGVAATQVGELKGKVPYMAPEHIRGKELDRRADVFSIAVLFYQLVSGAHPFLADTDQLTMARISSLMPAVPLRQRVPSVSEELSRVVDVAMAKDRDKRTKTALELMHEIERAVPGASMSSTNDIVAAWMKDLVSNQIEVREDELRDALRDLDLRSSLPPEHMRTGRRGTMPSIAPGQAIPIDMPATNMESGPPPPVLDIAADVRLGQPDSNAPRGTAPPIFAEATSTETAIARATTKPESPSFLSRHSRAVFAGGAVAVAVGILLLASGSPKPDVGSGENTASSSKSAISASSPDSANAPPSAAPRPADTAAPASGEDAGAAAPSVSAAPTAEPSTSAAVSPAAPSSTSSSGKVPWKKKKEYTPGGI